MFFIYKIVMEIWSEIRHRNSTFIVSVFCRFPNGFLDLTGITGIWPANDSAHVCFAGLLKIIIVIP